MSGMCLLENIGVTNYSVEPVAQISKDGATRATSTKWTQAVSLTYLWRMDEAEDRRRRRIG